MNPEWKAKLEETLGLSRDIISGKAGLVSLEMELTIQDTFSKPNIRSVFKDETGGIGFSVVKVLVNRFIESFAFSNKLNDTQIELLTVDTLENFAYESIEDIIIFFKMARSGKFGNTKRGVDSNLIFGEWYPMYLTQKSEERERNYNKKKAFESRKQATDEDIEVTYKKIKSNIEKRNKESSIIAFIEKITKNIDRQLLEDLITDWKQDEKRKPWIYLLKEKRKTIK